MPYSTRIAERLAAIAAQPQVSIEHATPSGGRDGRSEDRRPVFRNARVILIDGSEASCIVTDISAGGARIKLEGACALPEMIKLKLAPTGETRRARVVWQRGKAAGLSFVIERPARFGCGGAKG